MLQTLGQYAGIIGGIVGLISLLAVIYRWGARDARFATKDEINPIRESLGQLGQYATKDDIASLRESLSQLGQYATKDDIILLRDELSQLKPQINTLMDFYKVSLETTWKRFIEEAKANASNPFSRLKEYLDSEEGRLLRDILSDQKVPLEEKVLKALSLIGFDSLEAITGEKNETKAVGKIALYIEQFSKDIAEISRKDSDSDS